MDDLFQTALREHQRGRLQEARQGYQAVLSVRPDHADALHLLGVSGHQLGHHEEAARLIARAIALRPACAAYHANLGAVLNSLGRFDRAAACCRAALRLRPDYAEAANNLGLALLHGGDVPAAVEQFRAAVRLNPGYAMAHNNLGNALRAAGDAEAAVGQFRRALACEPQLAEAHSNLGQLLCEREEFDEALPHCREAVRLRPNFAEAHSNLGNVLRALGRLGDAKECYAAALRLNPALGVVYNNMAQALQEEGRLDEALLWYQQALAREPHAARIHCNLASALSDAERFDEAAEHFRTALRLDPAHAEARNGLGFLLHEQGRDEEAKGCFREALRLKPDFAAAHCNLGVLLEEHNDLSGAEARFREATAHDPDHAGARAQLAMLLRGKLLDADFAALRDALNGEKASDADRALLHFGLAHVLDARGEYAAAADHLRQGNALNVAGWQKRGQGYDPAAHTQFVTELIAACGPAFFERLRGLGPDSERPVFVVGLPRSGTTLVEQILASHSQVFGAGELRLARDGFESLPALVGGGEAPLDCLGRLGGEELRALGRRHLDALNELNADRPRVVDKMPGNYLYLGLLAAVFPRARFVHCRRDPRDVAVSCWMTNFRHIRWASDFDHLAGRFREYRRLTEHWRAVLPVPVLEVNYEDTVADLEGTARRLLAWCGLEWEPACLAFHETSRPVRTASLTQVRQPLYTRSVGRWKNYETALGELFAQLP